MMGRRDCGCPLQELGWTSHIHTLRNGARLSAGGTKLFDADVAHVLDTILPTQFGGGPTDYQLWEEEAAGLPRLRLLIHPRVGPLDAALVRAAFLAEIGREDGAERIASLVWREADLLQVERRAPLASGGKIPPVRRGPVEWDHSAAG
jgi:hypothetical protein